MGRKIRKINEETANQLVSATHGFKFIAADGKRLSDTLDSRSYQISQKLPKYQVNEVFRLVLYNDNTIDGQSKKNNAVRATWRA